MRRKAQEMRLPGLPDTLQSAKGVAGALRLGMPEAHQSAKGVAGALLLEPLYHQHIAGTCRSKDGCAERGSMSLRSTGVWNSFRGARGVVPLELSSSRSALANSPRIRSESGLSRAASRSSTRAPGRSPIALRALPSPEWCQASSGLSRIAARNAAAAPAMSPESLNVAPR